MLAHKSRKNNIEKEIVENQFLKVAGYVRLSVNKDNNPSESIENQKKIINDYTKTNLELKLEKFYVDNKVSGREFDRVAFNQLLDDINLGKINCVIVKDLSRLGRNMIEVGYYVQMFFPSKNVRFISIGNKIDTLDGMTNITFGELPKNNVALTSLMDEQYTNDISKKTQSVVDDYIKDGKYVAPRAPYGYRKSDNDCHLLVPDTEAANVVKDIFSMAFRKAGINEIVSYLNNSEILTPINYTIANGLKGNYKKGNGLWNSRTVKDILTNRTYVGDLQQGKNKYVVECTHEAIVDREIFDSVQQILVPAKNSNKTNIAREDNILRGKVICGCCGGKLQRRKGSGNADWHFFTCISKNRLGAGHCIGMYVRESDIIEAIKAETSQYIAANKATNTDYENDKNYLTNRLDLLKREMHSIQDDRQLCYEKLIQGEITENEYKQGSAKVEELQFEMDAFEDDIKIIENEYQKHLLFCNANSKDGSLKEIIQTYLKEVIVCKDKQMTVNFN